MRRDVESGLVRIQALLNELAHEIAPLDAGDHAVVNQFCLIVGWMGLEDGEEYIDIYSMPQTRITQLLGMITFADKAITKAVWGGDGSD